MKFSDKEVEFLIRALVSNYAEDERDFDPQDITDHGMAHQVLGELMATDQYRKGHQHYRQANKERCSGEAITKKLFMGSGNYSIVAKNKLHRRLEFAISELGALEQNGGMGTEFDIEMDKECRENIKNVIGDMMVAFGLTVEDLK